MKLTYKLQYAQEGLVMTFYKKTNNIGRVLVSNDYPRIFEFLGLDYSKYKAGFNTLEDIFNFVASSPYFDASRYQFDQLNKINRDRNKKRKSYLSLLAWIEENQSDREYRFKEDKSEYLIDIDEAFPEADIMAEIKRLEYQECKSLYIKSKFNGGQVMLKYGLKGPELGSVLEAFKMRVILSGEDFSDYVLKSSKDSIYDDFDYFYNKIYSTNEH